MLNNILKKILPSIEGFYEVKLNGITLQYWEHRSNFIKVEGNKLEVFTPTTYAKDKRESKGLDFDWKEIVEELKESTMDENISKILFTYVFRFNLSRFSEVHFTNDSIHLQIDNTELTLFKSSTSKNWDKLNIPNCIDFDLIN